MAYEITWEPAGVVCHFSGIVTNDEIVAVKAEVFDDPRILEIRYQIADFAMLEKFEISPEAVREVAGMDRTLAESNPDVKVAVITAASYVRGIANLYSLTHESMGGSWIMEAFEHEEDARAWVMSSV